MISFSAKILELIMRAVDLKNDRPKSQKTKTKSDKYGRPPKFISDKYKVEHTEIMNSSCYTIRYCNNSDVNIVFFHGGAYREQAVILHWFFMAKMMKELKCDITFIDYPLIPEHNCIDTIKMVTQAYKQLFGGSTQEIVLMGDSAGGGLALALAQIIKKDDVIPKPQKIVLLSPWLDIAMENEILPALYKNDRILNINSLRENAKIYAGDLDYKDPLCSPLYGDSKNIGDIALFIGKYDILSIDAAIFKKKAELEDWNLYYCEYEQMQHVFMLFPIPESKDVVNKICAFIKS